VDVFQETLIQSRTGHLRSQTSDYFFLFPVFIGKMERGGEKVRLKLLLATSFKREEHSEDGFDCCIYPFRNTFIPHLLFLFHSLSRLWREKHTNKQGYVMETREKSM